MGDEVSEIVGFLADPRADVRAMAAEGVAGYTATPEGTTALVKNGECLYPALVKLLSRTNSSTLSDCGGAAAMACAALVNLSQQPRERLRVLDAGPPSAVVAAASCVAFDEPPELAEYASMLLANLTQLSAGVEQLLKDGNAEAIATILLPRFAAAPLADAGARLAHISHALTNIAQLISGRAAILDALAKSSSSNPKLETDGAADSPHLLFSTLCGQLAASDEARRLGTARFLRNLCFAAAPKPEEDGARGPLMAVHRPLIVALACRLAVRNAEYRDEEKESFHAEVVAALGAEMISGAGTAEWPPKPKAEGQEEVQSRVPAEGDAEARLAVTEALLLLSASSEACVTMRELGIYPILRDAHLAEESRHVRDANEQLVDVFYLSVEAMGKPPPEAVALGAPEAGEEAAVEEVLD